MCSQKLRQFVKVVIKRGNWPNSLSIRNDVPLRYATVLMSLAERVISNSKGLYEILRDILTSTYQICRIEEKINRTPTFNKFICNWTPEVRDIVKILWKRGEISPLFHNIFHLL